MKNICLADVLSDTILQQAWNKVYENQGCAGVDGQSLEAFAADRMQQLDTLRQEVLYETYQPQPLIRVDIEKPSGGLRGLAIPAVRDRVLQTAVALCIEPIFEAEFEDCSFAYRKGRSVQQAVERIQTLQRQGYNWVVDADITSFFDNIDHSLLFAVCCLLFAEVERLLIDDAIVNLIKRWVKARVLDNHRYLTLEKGVPQGSPLSPLLSNLYLDHLDDILLENDLCLVRFADDFLVLCKTQAHAEQALQLTEQILSDLRLSVNRRKTQVIDFQRGFRFLGVQFIRSLALPIQDKEDDPFDLPKILPPFSIQLSLSEDEPDAAINKDPELSTEPTVNSEVKAETAEELPVNHDPLLRTLYVLQHGQVLGKESERLTLRKGKELLAEIPAIKVDQVIVFGNAQITTQAMQLCLQERIPIYLLSGHGRFFGVVDSFTTEPVLLQREQFLRADDPTFCLHIAAAMLRGKLINTRVLLLRLARRHPALALRTAADDINAILPHLQTAATLEQLRGFEGNAAKLYFKALIATLDKDWQFTQRKRQPPTDPVNALLSYGYTLLFYNMYSLLRTRGLNPQVGFLQALHAGHPALVSDCIEEFRAPIVEAVVWKLVLNRELTPDDFEYTAAPEGACLLKPAARQHFIKALEAKLNSAIRHPATGADLDYRRCMEYQVQHLAAVIRGTAVHYQPMLIR